MFCFFYTSAFELVSYVLPAAWGRPQALMGRAGAPEPQWATAIAAVVGPGQGDKLEWDT